MKKVEILYGGDQDPFWYPLIDHEPFKEVQNWNNVQFYVENEILKVIKGHIVREIDYSLRMLHR